MNNNATQSLYHKSSVRISLGIILLITLLFNLGTSFYIFLRLKLSPHIKKILIALQFSNLLVTILIILGYILNFHYEENQWSYGLLCDTLTVFYHNSFVFSHMISRIRFYMADQTSQVRPYFSRNPTLKAHLKTRFY